MKYLDSLNLPNMSKESLKSKVITPSMKEWNKQRKIKSKMRKTEVFRPDTLLIVIDGSEGRPVWADKDSDDQRLLFEEDGMAQECKITSKGLKIGSTNVYFTRDGFKGTMAVNKETLLDADVYKPEADGDGFKGDIEELLGSKATLRSSNEALRERKLLKPQKMSRGKILMTLGTGTAVGLVLATQLGI